MIYFNAHTHQQSEEPDSISLVNLEIQERLLTDFPEPDSRTIYSSGIHPRAINDGWQKDLQTIESLLQQKKLSAIGECGLDKVCNTPFELQEKVFIAQITLANEYHVPLIIHCVKAFDHLLSIRKNLSISCPMVIHGYRGGTGLTSQLLKERFLYFSFGSNYSTDSLKKIPPERLFMETDVSSISIITAYRQVASTLQISEQVLAEQTLTNKKRVFPL